MVTRRQVAGGAIFFGVIGLVVAWQFAGVRPSPTPGDTRFSYLSLPDGFDIEVYAGDYGGSSLSYPGPDPGPRLLRFHEGTLFASIPAQGRIVAIPDADGDRSADRTVTVVDGLNRPHGFDFHDGMLYIANTGSIVRYELDGLQAVAESGTTLVDSIPTGGHWTRTLEVADDSMFISVGSSCNVCRESNRWRAAITRCELDGTGCETFADGLRNTVDFMRYNGSWFGTDNGRDHLGDELPPDEVNVIEEGGDYGWPFCYGQQIPDPSFDDGSRCEDTLGPAVELQAHSAPLGLTFYNGTTLPGQYRHDMFVAYHGSWNRQPPTGYKIVRIPYGNGTLGEPQDFVHGWLQGTTVKGRPVDVVFGPEGDMFISDDNAGRIYRVWYEK